MTQADILKKPQWVVKAPLHYIKKQEKIKSKCS